MAFNITTDALELTFNEQSAVIGMAFVLSLLSSALLAAFLFGVLEHVNCQVPIVPEMSCDCGEGACCVMCNYVGYKYCPTCCCTDWRRHMKEQIAQMQEELNAKELEEMRARDEKEREDYEKRRAEWAETEKKSRDANLKNK